MDMGRQTPDASAVQHIKICNNQVVGKQQKGANKALGDGNFWRIH